MSIKSIIITKHVTAKLSKNPSIKSTAGGVPRATAPRSSVIGSGTTGSIKQQAAEPTSEEFSEDESTYGSSEEETPQPPIPATRPTSAMDAVRYDTIKSLWYPPIRSASREEIVKSLEDFWEVVRTIRDRWKSDASAVKDAEEAKKVNEIPLLKERVSRQRDMLETALRSALEAGHQDVVEQYVYPILPISFILTSSGVVKPALLACLWGCFQKPFGSSVPACSQIYALRLRNYVYLPMLET